jgi:hypothetical protein
MAANRIEILPAGQIRGLCPDEDMTPLSAGSHGYVRIRKRKERCRRGNAGTENGSGEFMDAREFVQLPSFVQELRLVHMLEFVHMHESRDCVNSGRPLRLSIVKLNTAEIGSS